MVYHEQPSKNKSRILIVDDHAIVREGLSLLINQEKDLEVCATAENADDALKLVRENNIDLAVVDISLEGTSGLQLTERIKVCNPHLPVLILTMHDEEFYAKRAFRAGAKGFLTKHEASDTVITAIRMMLAGRSYISDSMTQKFLKKIHGDDTEV
ncbi:MAG: response regulator transcription factor [Phycisphaerae bacterium]|jgi:DNA-binding NarL/FixJ family response regulator